MKVAEVTAHAMYFQVPLFLYHQQVDGAGGHPGGGPGGPGGTLGPGGSRRSTWSKRNIRIIKEFWRRRIIGIISSFILRCNQLQLTSHIFFPEHNNCPRARIKCGAEKVELGYRTNPHANWSWTGFPEDPPGSGFTAGRKDVRIATEVALENRTALEVHIRQKWSRRTAICGEKFLCKYRLIPVQDQLFPWVQWFAFVNGVPNICSHIFGKLRTAGRVIVANARFWSFFPSGRSLIQFVANNPSSRMLKLARSRKLLISACCRYCGAWIERVLCLGYTVSKNCSNLPFCWNHMFAWVWNYSSGCKR